LYNEYLKPAGKAGMVEGAKLAASRIGDRYFGPNPTKKPIRDRAEPTQGLGGTQLFSPKSAQHIPINWIDGLRGNPWSAKEHYYTTFPSETYPKGSLFPRRLCRDSFTYVSPFSGVSYVDTGALRDRTENGNEYRTYGGIAPLYAWGVKETSVKFTAKGEIHYKWAKTYFFKEVFDDWMALHGYAPYDAEADGMPAMGWPGVMNCIDPFSLDFTGSAEPFIGIKHWVTQNQNIAHFEFGEEITAERQQRLRPPEYYLTDKYEKLKIQYPSGAISGRDNIPVYYPLPESTPAIPAESPPENTGDPPEQVVLTDAEAQRILDAWQANSDSSTTIPVLPSNPPATAGDDPDLFFKLFDKFNMNAGYASYRKNGVDIVADGQGYPVYDLDEAYRVALRTDNVQGFAYENSGSTKWWFGNNWNPGQLGVSNFPEYNNYFSYYSRWVVPAAEYMRVGIVFTTEVPGLNGFMGHISETGYEMNDRADTVEFETFEGGVNLDDFDEKTDFLLHLAGQVGATRRANKWEDVQCCGFEVDLRDGTGYFTRYL